MKTTIEGAGLRFMTLDVYRVSREIVVRVGRLGLRDAELRSQATRAAQSLLLNLSEGLPSRSEPMRRRYFASARGSTYEVAAAVDVAAALGHCPEEGGSAAAHAVRPRERDALPHEVASPPGSAARRSPAGAVTG